MKNISRFFVYRHLLAIASYTFGISSHMEKGDKLFKYKAACMRRRKQASCIVELAHRILLMQKQTRMEKRNEDDKEEEEVTRLRHMAIASARNSTATYTISSNTLLKNRLVNPLVCVCVNFVSGHFSLSRANSSSIYSPSYS